MIESSRAPTATGNRFLFTLKNFMNRTRLTRRDWIAGNSALGLCLAASKAGTAQSDRPAAGNSQVVDLTDLTGELPLDVLSTQQILQQTEDWEHSTWKNPRWPAGGGDSVGYPSVVKNVLSSCAKLSSK